MKQQLIIAYNINIINDFNLIYDKIIMIELKGNENFVARVSLLMNHMSMI